MNQRLTSSLSTILFCIGLATLIPSFAHAKEAWTTPPDSHECELFIPNAFNPDGDGLNDQFKVRSNCEFDYFHLRIFSRRGPLIWETKDRNEAWDGQSLDGLQTDLGVYAYQLIYRWQGAREREARGSVTRVW